MGIAKEFIEETRDTVQLATGIKPVYAARGLRIDQPWAYNFDVFQTIAPRQFFSVELHGVPFVTHCDVDITVMLNGLTAFAVQ